MLPLLQANNYDFPPPHLAMEEPNGLLAVGGDLSPRRLLSAYYQGIFPWYESDQPILWWSPDPRIGMTTSQVHVSRSMAKFIRRTELKVTLNHAFRATIEACSSSREGHTWITPEMIEAYCLLHQLGQAHSIEVWQDEQQVGGLYGVAVGRLFCGESMFSYASNASKLALISFAKHFAEHNGAYIDGQVHNPHLESLGMQELAREDFLTLLQEYRSQELLNGCWQKQQL